MKAKYYWLCLLASIIFEVSASTIMKATQNSWPVTGMLLMYLLVGVSYFFLARAVIKLPVGVAYAFWEGLGLTLITIVSVTWLGEEVDFLRILGIILILGGILLVHQGTTSPDLALKKDPALKPADFLATKAL